MGWLEQCYQIYEKNRSEVGKLSFNHRGWEAPMLLPVSHTTQKANVEVNLSGDGEFLSARVLRPDEMTTVIPCTEKSSARTSGPVPHPLADKLQYIAGDYPQYGGPKESCWAEYLAQLRAWCDSPFGLESLRAVFTYLEKGCLIADLLEQRILYTGEDGRLLQKWIGPKEETPDIFQSVKDPFETFVRFRVNGKSLSSDPSVWESYTSYYLSTLQETGVCYVQGREMPISFLSPYKIRNAGDRAKLISSNDNINFTYRGRFENVEEALSISYETTQKAHSALRWLIGRQGIQNGDQTILVWGSENEPIPPVTGDSCDLACSISDEEELGDIFAPETPVANTREAFARQFNKAIQGYRHKLSEYSQILVMILDSATPGRLSIRYYRELSGSHLMDCIESWHRNFAWEMRYRSLQQEKNGKKTKVQVVFTGAPSPADIAEAAYGTKVDAKLKQQTIERLLPCITEARSFPRDLMLSAVRRASNGIALQPWEANKVRNIACALVRGCYHQYKKEDFTMAIYESCRDRNYLFGRILACADQVEQYASYTANESTRRPTNALRYETAFTQRPAKTTELLRKQLLPYLERLIKSNKSTYAGELMLSLIDRIPPEDFTNAPLNELYLLGYASQRAEFYKKAETTAAESSVVTE